MLTTAAVLSACGPPREDPRPQSADPSVQAGFDVVRARSCTSCHSVDGTSRSAPTFQGLAGSAVELRDGSTVVVDEDYLKRAILDPDAEVRRGERPGVMSSFMRNQEPLSDEELSQIVAYLKSLEHGSQ